MCDEEHGFENFDEWVRSVARDIGRSAERMADFDLDEVAGAFGVDRSSARQWMDNASQWLRAQFEGVAGEAPGGPADTPPASTPAQRPAPSAEAVDPLRHAAPHPLDVPSEEQGLALSALISGRWAIEPGSDALASRGGGPGPSDALGIVRELRVRDWITADGEVTAVGRHALARWLELGTR